MAEVANLITFKRPILTMHAGPSQIYFPKEHAPHLALMFKFIFGVAKSVICNSENVKKKIVEYGINPEKIIPIQAFSVQYLQFLDVSFNGSLKSFLEKKDILISSYVFFRPEFFINDMIKGFSQVHKNSQNLDWSFWVRTMDRKNRKN